jgi:hypothetical protein
MDNDNKHNFDRRTQPERFVTSLSPEQVQHAAQTSEKNKARMKHYVDIVDRLEIGEMQHSDVPVWGDNDFQRMLVMRLRSRLRDSNLAASVRHVAKAFREA